MEPFRVHILGCGSALPTPRHFASSQIVEVRGKLLMVDCGEGTQIQLRRSHLRFTKLSSVFISHLHGDHCLGLVGMISTFGMLGRTAPLHVYAEARLAPLLRQQMDMFCSDLGYEVVFHALRPQEQAVVCDDRSFTVTTIPLSHRLPTCGFIIAEKPQLPHINRERADYYGIPPSRFDSIKQGSDWTMNDGTVIANERLVTPAEPPRAYAYCSDTRYLPLLHTQLQGVTTLYHESTYGDDNQVLADKYFHSTARQAATVARDAGVRQLILGHYSSRYGDEQLLLNEARQVFDNAKLASELEVFDG